MRLMHYAPDRAEANRNDRNQTVARLRMLGRKLVSMDATDTPLFAGRPIEAGEKPKKREAKQRGLFE